MNKVETARLKQIVWALTDKNTDKDLAKRDFERFVRRLSEADRIALRDTLAEMLQEAR